MAQNHILKGWRYGFTNGFVIINNRFNEVTNKKDIVDYYNGGLDYTNPRKIFTDNIEEARFFSSDDQAQREISILNIEVPGYPGVFCYVEKAHCEYY